MDQSSYFEPREKSRHSARREMYTHLVDSKPRLNEQFRRSRQEENNIPTAKHNTRPPFTQCLLTNSPVRALIATTEPTIIIVVTRSPVDSPFRRDHVLPLELRAIYRSGCTVSNSSCRNIIHPTTVVLCRRQMARSQL